MRRNRWTKNAATALLIAMTGACTGNVDDPNATHNASVDRVASLEPGRDTARDRRDAFTCGAPPYAALSLHMWEPGDRDLVPLAGAKLTFDACPHLDLATNDFGTLDTQVTRGAPMIARITTPGHVTVIVSQSHVDVDSIMSDIAPALDRTQMLPHYAPDRPTLSVYLTADGTGACASTRSVTLRIANHPQANTVYMKSTWPLDVAPSSGTASEGVAVFFTGLSAGAAVQIEGTKPGCRVHVAESEQTGIFTLENGAWTVGNVYVSDL